MTEWTNVLTWKVSMPEEGIAGSNPAGSVEYYTDGNNLYEIIAEDYFRNSAVPQDRPGRPEASTFIREVAIRDCLTGETAVIRGTALAKLRKVCER